MLFVRSEQARFVEHCHRVQALAAHAAALLGVDRQSAVSYADDVMAFTVQGASDHALVERVRADLAASGVVVDAAELERYLGPGVPQPELAPGSDIRITPAMERGHGRN